MSSYAGVAVSDQGLQSQFTQVELRTLKSKFISARNQSGKIKLADLPPVLLLLKNVSEVFNVEQIKTILEETSLDISGEADFESFLQDGLRRTIESYSHLRAQSQVKKEGPSKASIYLGSRRVADILLRRDAKKTLATMLILAAVYFNFIASACTIVTAVGKIFLGVSIFLVIHGILPMKMMLHEWKKQLTLG